MPPNDNGPLLETSLDEHAHDLHGLWKKWICELPKAVKVWRIMRNMTQLQLARGVSARIGKRFDQTTMSKVMWRE